MLHAQPAIHDMRCSNPSIADIELHFADSQCVMRDHWWARGGRMFVLFAVVALAVGCKSSTTNEPVTDASVDDSDGAIDQTLLGSACKQHSDCGDQGLICAGTKDDGLYGGYVVNGLCTKECEGADDSSCLAFGGLCENVSDNVDSPVWRCLQICEPGGATMDPSKCHGRAELACAALNVDLDLGVDSLGLCYPVCDSNSTCSGGDSCDEGLGVCHDGKNKGDAFGTACDPKKDTCAGQCIGYADDKGKFTYGYCSQPCVYGADDACALSVDVDADCRFVEVETAGPGDYAYCQPICSTNADCESLPADKDVYCDLSLIPVLGHGLCEWGVPPEFPDAGMAMNGDAGVDASNK